MYNNAQGDSSGRYPQTAEHQAVKSGHEHSYGAPGNTVAMRRTKKDGLRDKGHRQSVSRHKRLQNDAPPGSLFDTGVQDRKGQSRGGNLPPGVEMKPLREEPEVGMNAGVPEKESAH